MGRLGNFQGYWEPEKGGFRNFRGFSAAKSAAEVEAALVSYRKESDEVVPADAAVRQAQLAAAALRPAADGLIDDVKSDLSHAMRKLSGPAIRRVLRLFGFKFQPNPGETPEPAPVPTPVTP